MSKTMFFFMFLSSSAVEGEKQHVVQVIGEMGTTC